MYFGRLVSNLMVVFSFMNLSNPATVLNEHAEIDSLLFFSVGKNRMVRNPSIFTWPFSCYKSFQCVKP